MQQEISVLKQSSDFQENMPANLRTRNGTKMGRYDSSDTKAGQQPFQMVKSNTMSKLNPHGSVDYSKNATIQSVRNSHQRASLNQN